MPWSKTPGGIWISVRVTPKASANRIQGTMATGDETRALKCQVTAPPDAGKANAALLKMLGTALGCPKTSLSIQSGASDRNKVVAVSGDPDVLEEAVRKLLDGAAQKTTRK